MCDPRVNRSSMGGHDRGRTLLSRSPYRLPEFHGDSFDLPPTALNIAAADSFPNRFWTRRM